VNTVTVTGPADLVPVFRPLLAGLPHERLAVAVCDRHGRVRAVRAVADETTDAWWVAQRGGDRAGRAGARAYGSRRRRWARSSRNDHGARVRPMFLSRMAVASYRCFDQRQDIELCPVTVILGRNNSGKSALVRAPVVFGTGIQTDSPAPLDLDVLGEDMFESFNDLIYGNRPHGSVIVELEFNGQSEPPLWLAATVQHIDEYRTQVVSSLEFQAGEARARLEWELTDPPDEIARYAVEAGDLSFPGVPVVFQGLLPADVRDPRLPDELVSQLVTAARTIRGSTRPSGTSGLFGIDPSGDIGYPRECRPRSALAASTPPASWRATPLGNRADSSNRSTRILGTTYRAGPSVLSSVGACTRWC
jgi:hypothetical protein